MGAMQVVVPLIVLILITILQQDSCYGASIKKQVTKVIQKNIKNLENRLMKSINDVCHKPSCASVYYRSCQDALDNGNVFSSQYMIQPDDGSPFLVYCDMDLTEGNGWVVFQRRFDGSVDFFRNWTDYVRGFGNINGEFWLGLENIHRLTNRQDSFQPTKLRVELKDYDGSEAFAEYSKFIVRSAVHNYELLVTFSNGTAGDSLSTHHSGAQFSTPDMDNDEWSVFHCAQQSHGAWWYNMCHESNLNGRYSPTTTYGTEYARWRSWKGTQSLKATTMKLAAGGARDKARAH